MAKQDDQKFSLARTRNSRKKSDSTQGSCRRNTEQFTLRWSKRRGILFHSRALFVQVFGGMSPRVPYMKGTGMLDGNCELTLHGRSIWTDVVRLDLTP